MPDQRINIESDARDIYQAGRDNNIITNFFSRGPSTVDRAALINAIETVRIRGEHAELQTIFGENQPVNLNKTRLAGGGKSIALLALTRDLLNEAKQDPAVPVPILLSLSTWNPGANLTAWIIEEMLTLHQFPRRIRVVPTSIRGMGESPLTLC